MICILYIIVIVNLNYHIFSFNSCILNNSPLTLRKVTKSLKHNNSVTIHDRVIIQTELFLSFQDLSCGTKWRD